MSAKEYNFTKAERGPVVRPRPGTTQITLRIDTEVVEWFRKHVHDAGGGNYQTLINDALRAYIQAQDEALEGASQSVAPKKFQPVLS